MVDDNYCPDCKKFTDVVQDHSAGDTICTEWGLVLGVNSIDESCEWRTFADGSRDNDPVRVGEASNPLLDSGRLQTVISKPHGSKGDFLSSSLRIRQNKGLKSEQGLILGFRDIAAMADRLGIFATIKDRANEIYKKVDDAKLRGRNRAAILAACLYIACRQEGKPRTLNEIHSVANGARKNEISKAVKYIEQLGIATSQLIEMTSIRADDFLKRFCSRLGMKYQEIRASEYTVQKIQELDIRRSPISVAAAVIYMISQLSTEKKSLKDIALVTKVAESTIKSCYKDLYPYASRIIPDSYAKEDDLKKLFCP